LLSFSIREDFEISQNTIVEQGMLSQFVVRLDIKSVNEIFTDFALGDFVILQGTSVLKIANSEEAKPIICEFMITEEA
jgi:hypothetical protein